MPSRGSGRCARCDQTAAGLRRAVSGTLLSPRRQPAGHMSRGRLRPARDMHIAQRGAVQYLQASFLAGHDRNPAGSRSRCLTCPEGGPGDRRGCRLFRFLVRARVITAHRLPPAAIHRHTLVSWGPLAITTQDSNRSTILTRPAPARRGTGAGPPDLRVWPAAVVTRPDGPRYSSRALPAAASSRGTRMLSVSAAS
jgi:hypothetical protein